MHLIVLSGKAHSGKSTVSKYLSKKYGYVRVSLAFSLKDDIFKMGFDGEDIVEKPPWMRQLMIAYGQARRAVNPNHWVDIALARISDGLHTGVDMFVCDDCRFVNEADIFTALRKEGHDVDLIRLDRIGGPSHLSDSSETELDDYEGFDATITAMSGDTAGLIERVVEHLKL